MASAVTHMHFRHARVDDFEQIIRLYRQLQPNDPVLADGRDRAVFERILASDGLHLLVIEDGGPVIATCYLNIIPNITRSARPYAIIENVVTDVARRNQGMGKLLLRETLAFAWSHGCYKAMLQTGSKTAATHAFYRACGFSPDDKTGYVARPA
jgi:GNAT superfamily N-acetyltransferase